MIGLWSRLRVWKDRVWAVRVRTDPGVRELVDAVVRDDVVELRRLLAEGVEVNSVGGSSVNLLTLAMNNACLDTFTALLDAGIDTGVRSESGKMAVHYAASVADARYLEILLRYGGEVNARETTGGETALMLCEGNRDHLRMLLAAGADPDVADELGRTVLHREAVEQNYRAVLDLLEAGADHALEDREGRTFQYHLGRVRPIDGDTEEHLGWVVDWLRDHDVPVTTRLHGDDDQPSTGRDRGHNG